MPQLANWQKAHAELLSVRDTAQQAADRLPKLLPGDAFPEILGDALQGQPPNFALLLTSIGTRPAFRPQFDAFLSQPDGEPAPGQPQKYMADRAQPGTIESVRLALTAVDGDAPTKQDFQNAGQAVRSLMRELFPPDGMPPV